MGQKRKNWTRDELIIAFNLYCRTPFGHIHKTNREIMQVSQCMGRTASALAMKMVNFASLDPVHQSRRVKGLKHTSAHDQRIWAEFHENWETLAFESQQALERLIGKSDNHKTLKIQVSEDNKPTEIQRTVQVRLVQKFFRDTVLSSYNFSCAICQLGLIEMLNASHIIPWSIDKNRRADPQNGLSLCVFHDRAFDRGLITIDEGFRVILSGKIKVSVTGELHRVGFLDVEGQNIRIPDRFGPDPVALAYHRENIFIG